MNGVGIGRMEFVRTLAVALFVLPVAAAAEIGPATLVCHRGERSGGAADNSLEAFTRAATCAMSFECDVRIDGAGRVYCSHDKLTDGASRPTYFREVLPLARNGRWIVVDVKGEKGRFDDLAAALRRDLSEQKVASPSNLRFVCSDLDMLKAVRRELPAYPILWLTGCALRGDFPEEAMSADEMIARTRGGGANGVDLSDRPEIFTKEFIGRLLAAGLEVHMCTQGRRSDVEDAFRRGAQTVLPLIRAREILEEILSEKENKTK